MPVDRDVEHTNVYLYNYLNLLEDLTLTVGASGDFFDAAGDDSQGGEVLGVTISLDDLGGN